MARSAFTISKATADRHDTAAHYAAHHDDGKKGKGR